MLEIAGDMLEILSVADATAHAFNKIASDELIENQVVKLADILKRIARKHLSDGATVGERQAFVIEVLETAVKIAKGELVP
jgi:hypothetical protein